MRIGLAGLGRIGTVHARTLAGLDAVGSLVVADAVPEVTDRVSRAVGAEPAPSVTALLADGIDGLVVAAATDAHPALLRAAVDAGIPVFCEKPVAATPQEALRLRAELAGRDERVQIDFPRRFDAAFVAARAAVAAGELGHVHTVRSTTLDPAPPPAAYLAVSGGIFHDCAVHDFDAVRWVTGRDVVEVYATGDDGGDPVYTAIGDAHTVSSILTLDDGAPAVVSNARRNARGYDVRLEVHGTADSVAAGHDDGLPLRRTEPGAPAPGPAHTFFMDRFAEAFRAELVAFTEVVAGTRPSPCTVADAVAATLVAEAATRSRRERRPVRVRDIENGE
ncbi:Gfo/Idh/MocA family protein [Pseudonocardia sp.]|uniref:Gfo/Idh/MocA family protein n=1 Tax=Pseudonocardia sp. TaxID=60912 RepID=UPI003D09B7E5